jgi:hypothetical protein
MTIATGQITIIDYNDALTLTGFITSNHPKTQQHNPDNGSFIPNWSSSNLVLTPSLYKLGGTSDIIGTSDVQSITWYDAKSPGTPLVNGTTYGIPASGIKTLTVKQNVLADKPAIDFICEVVYKDPTTKLNLTHKTGISFNKVINGGGISDAVAWAPNGNIFKNNTVTTLDIECDLWRGSVIDTDDVSYRWYKMDGTATTTNGGDADGGNGWRLLANATNQYAGATTRKLTVYSSQVANYGVFKCIIKDLDSTSGTYGELFMDTVTLVDQSDPIQVSITSTGGDVFKNGSGSTTLRAVLFQAGQEYDSGGTKTYRWYKYDQNGDLVTGWGGATDYKTGKSIDIGGSDVDVKATFKVEIL